MHRRLPATTRLRDRTIKLYNQHLDVYTREEVAKATGLSKTWLHHFGRGMLTHPSVNNVECLYVYLTGHPIEL